MAIDKASLRISARQLRDHANASNPNASRELAGRFPIKLFERFGPTVAGYLAIGSELDPAPLLDRLKNAGAEICLPRVEADDSMTFRRVADERDLEAGPFGLTQPSADAEIAHPTLVLAPLLAFDAAGNRLGYGKGHYDRALSKLRSDGRTFVCGLAYAEQEVLKIPAEETDVPLDWLMTPKASLPLFFGRVVG